MATTLYWNNLNNDGIYSTPSGWSYDQFGMTPYTDPTFPTDAFFRFDGQHTNAMSPCYAYTFMPNCVGVYLGSTCTPSQIDVGYGFDIGNASEGGYLYLGCPNLVNYSGALVLQGTPSPIEIHGTNSETSPGVWGGNVTQYVSSYAVQIHEHVRMINVGYSWTAIYYLGEPIIDVMSDSSLSIRSGAFVDAATSEYEANIGHFESSTLSASAGKVIWRCDDMSSAYFEYPPSVWADEIEITTTTGTLISSVQLPNIYYTAMTPTTLRLKNSTSNISQVTLELADDIDTTSLEVVGLVDVQPTGDLDFHPQTFSMQSTSYGDCAADFSAYSVDLQLRYLVLGTSTASAGSITFDRGDNALQCAGLYVHDNVTWTNGGSAPAIVLKEEVAPFTFTSVTLVDVGDIVVNDTGGSIFNLSQPNAGNNFMCTDLTVTNGIVQPQGLVEVSGNFISNANSPFGSPSYLSDFRVTGTAEIATAVPVQNLDCRNGSLLRCQKGGAWLAKHERPVYDSDLPRFSS